MAQAAACALLAALLVCAPRPSLALSCAAESPRANCGWDGVTEGACESMGCCWNATATPPCATRVNPDEVPAYGSYAVTADSGERAGKATFTPEGAQPPAGSSSSPLQTLRWTVDAQTESRLRVRVTDGGGDAPPRWEVPERLLADGASHEHDEADEMYDVEVVQSPFGFRVTRRGGAGHGETVFDTTAGRRPLVFHEQYLEFGTGTAAGMPVYGAGERIDPVRLPDNDTYTVFNEDPGGNPEHKNLYGAHPMVLHRTASGASAGLFLFSSNGMDVALGADDDLTFRVTGGVLDVFVFLGPEPADVVRQYHAVVGRPFVPPYWALGFHQCRWGYENVQALRDVVTGYERARLPLDTVWNDIDYMDKYHDFTLAADRYAPAEMRAFQKWLRSRDQHHIFIVDPAIAGVDGYAPYEEGLAAGVFVRSPANTSEPVFNTVWPHEPTAFPDFTANATAAWWRSQLEAFYDLAGTDSRGLWIDMNEPAGFCSGQFPDNCKVVTGPPWSEPPLPKPPRVLPASRGMPGPAPPAPALVGPPPYLPGGRDMYADTLNMSAVQAWGAHYDAHNLYGHTELMATTSALAAMFPGDRSFVLTRSTFAGSGALGAHWGGDNYSTFRSMRDSVRQLLSLGLFGVATAGADMCGFFGNTTEELCARWMSLGSLYPFSRNHNMWNTNSQEPYAFGDGSAVLEASRASLNRRYQLLPYLDTALRAVHEEGGAVMQPLWLRFPHDTGQVWNVDAQFMLGESLLVTPVLEEGAARVVGLLPGGFSTLWYRWEALEGALNGTLPRAEARLQGGASVSMDAPVHGLTPVHVLGGTVLPLHAGGGAPGSVGRSADYPFLNTADARASGHWFRAALDEEQSASGALRLDDGVSADGRGPYEGSVAAEFAPDPSAFPGLAGDGGGFRLTLNTTWRVPPRAGERFPVRGVVVQGVTMTVDEADRGRARVPVSVRVRRGDEAGALARAYYMPVSGTLSWSDADEGGGGPLDMAAAGALVLTWPERAVVVGGDDGGGGGGGSHAGETVGFVLLGLAAAAGIAYGVFRWRAAASRDRHARARAYVTVQDGF